MKPLSAYFNDVLLHRLSQILYHCFENVESTKGALYLYVSDENGFRLVTHYGWPRALPPPEQLGMNHPMVIWMQREKRTFAVNQANFVKEVSDFAQGGDQPRSFRHQSSQKASGLGF